MSEPTDQVDPLHPRQRPGGVRVEAEAATWESVVFAISLGLAVRYLEVPAAQVEAFLQNVDSGVLDDELAELATTPTGKSLNVPGRIRTLAAFDRLVRGAVARAERDPLSGELTGPGWRPRKRRRDDRSRSESDHQPDPTTHPTPAPRAPAHQHPMTPAGVGSAVGSVAKGGLWSSPVVAVGAVVAVVVAVAAVVFAVARPGSDPEQGAAAPPPVATSAAATSAEATSAPPGTSAAASSAAGNSAAGNSAAGSSAAGSSAAGTSAAATSAVANSAAASSATAGTGSGVPAVNPIAGTYAVTRTITANSGHPEAAIGTTESLDLTITAACAEPTCAVSVKGWGSAAVKGATLKFSGTATEPCKDSPGIAVEDAWSVTLKAGPADASGAVQSLTGVGTVTVSALNGCDAKVYPLTLSYTGTRTN